MQYALFHRFYGCLLGMVLGEQLGAASATGRALQHWQPDAGSTGRWSQMALQLAAELTRSRTWTPDLIERTDLCQVPRHELTSGTLAIAALPIALLFHDDLQRQRQALGQVVDAVQGDDLTRQWVTVAGYAIAQALRGQLNPALLVNQTQAYLRVATPQTAAQVTVLNLLDTHAQPTDLTTLTDLVAQTDTDVRVAIALSCISNPSDTLVLALLRSARLSQLQPSLSALVGAISGAANSSAAIPPAWITAVARFQPELLNQLQPLANRLLGAWAGIYEPSTESNADSLTVAAPWIMRSR